MSDSTDVASERRDLVSLAEGSPLQCALVRQRAAIVAAAIHGELQRARDLLAICRLAWEACRFEHFETMRAYLHAQTRGHLAMLDAGQVMARAKYAALLEQLEKDGER